MSQRLSRPFWPPALVQQAPSAILLAALRRFRGPALFRGLRLSSRLGAPFWPSGLTLRSSGPAFCGPLTLAVSTTETQLYSSPCLFKRHSVSQALFSAGFVVFLGFACWRCVLQALRCLGGAALFHSSRPSPNSCYPFWLLALTFRSSRPAYGGRLTSPVSLRKTCFI